MEGKKHEILENKMCKELEMLEEKYKGGNELSEVDLKRIDMLAHALKSLATYNAMKEAEEYGGGEYGMSGRRGRSPMTGRYVSRAMGPEMSYDDGYSGHYYPMPYDPRPRW